MVHALRVLQSFAAILFFFGACGEAGAGYKIQIGDEIEVAVASVPDFQHKSIVDVDGDVTVPLIAPVRVVGLELDEARKLIKERLSQKLYQQRTLDGRDAVVAIAPDAVTVSIAEFRPVYVNGDVTKPGAQVFRPGLTVRQAVAMAGGYEIMRFRMNNPFLESADLRNDYQSLWMQYVEIQGRVWQIRSELEPGGAGSLEQMTQAPLPARVLEQARTNAQQQLTLSLSRTQAEREYLEKTVKTADNQIASLKARQIKDDENAKVDSTEYEKLKEFSEHGNLPMTRLSEARRLFLFSATQSLQTGVQLVTAVRERDEAQRNIGRFNENRRSELLKDVEKATVELDSVRSRLQAVGEKITYTGMIRSQLSRRGEEPAIRIIRAPSNGGGDQTATEDTPLMPGDTVEVALHTEVPAVR